MMRILLFIFLSFLINTTRAQKYDFRKGHVIINRDTIKGFVHLSTDIKLIDGFVFKSESGDIQRYTTKNASGFYFSDTDVEFNKVHVVLKNYIGKLDTSYNFARLLVRGNLSLFRIPLDPRKHTKVFITDNDQAFIVKKDSSFYTISVNESVENNKYSVDESYKVTLNKLLYKCPTDKEKLAKMSFSESAIKNIIQRYNECVNPGNQKSTLKRKKVLLHGINAESYTSSISSFNDNISLGYQLEIYRPEISKKTSFITGLMLSRFINTDENRLKGKLTGVTVPTLLQFNFVAKNRFLSPFMTMGIHHFLGNVETFLGNRFTYSIIPSLGIGTDIDNRIKLKLSLDKRSNRVLSVSYNFH